MSAFSAAIRSYPKGDFPTCWSHGTSRTISYAFNFSKKHGPPFRIFAIRYRSPISCYMIDLVIIVQVSILFLTDCRLSCYVRFADFPTINIVLFY